MGSVKYTPYFGSTIPLPAPEGPQMTKGNMSVSMIHVHVFNYSSTKGCKKKRQGKDKVSRNSLRTLLLVALAILLIFEIYLPKVINKAGLST